MPTTTAPPDPLVTLARRAWQRAGPQRAWIVGYLLLYLGAQLVTLVEPLVIGGMIDGVVAAPTAHEKFQVAFRAAALFLGLQFLFWTMHGPGRVIERLVAFRIRRRHRATLFGALTRRSMDWHRDQHSGENIDRINRASTALFQFSEEIFMVVYMALRLVGALVLLTWFEPWAGLGALVISLVVVAMIRRFDRRLVTQYSELNRFEHRVASAVHDYVTNIVTVLTLRLEPRVRSEVERRMRSAYELFRSNVLLNEVKWFLVNMLIGVLVSVTLAGHVLMSIRAGRPILPGTMFTLFEYLRRIGDCFYNFAALYGELVSRATDVRTGETLETGLDEASTGQVVPALPENWTRLEVTGLHHTPSSVGAPLPVTASRIPSLQLLRPAPPTFKLENISLTLKRGSSLALVGSSGSGKSTLLTLLRGLVEPDRATLSIDGRPVENGLAPLASSTALLPQDPEIFADTIGFNVTFGLEAAPGEVDEALRLSAFAPVLARMPSGLDTHIAEKGVNLSGGERQRLALARGLFCAKDATLLLLDEPTSSVDSTTERAIYEDVLRHRGDRCIVSAIHRLHLLPLFDQVIVLEHGRIVESGDFATLMRGGGTLSRLWEAYQPDPLVAPAGI